PPLRCSEPELVNSRANRKLTVQIRRCHNFAPFLRQTGEGKAHTCAKAMFQQLSASWLSISMSPTWKLPSSSPSLRQNEPRCKPHRQNIRSSCEIQRRSSLDDLFEAQPKRWEAFSHYNRSSRQASLA